MWDRIRSAWRKIAGQPRGHAGERRQVPRQACTAAVTCQPAPEAAGPRWPAQVRDVGPGGIGLVLDHWVGPGALLAVNWPTGGHTSETVLACVRHASARPGGAWSLGCSFIRELSEEELQTLLDAPANP